MLGEHSRSSSPSRRSPEYRVESTDGGEDVRRLDYRVSSKYSLKTIVFCKKRWKIKFFHLFFPETRWTPPWNCSLSRRTPRKLKQFGISEELKSTTWRCGKSSLKRSTWPKFIKSEQFSDFGFQNPFFLQFRSRCSLEIAGFFKNDKNRKFSRKSGDFWGKWSQIRV